MTIIPICHKIIIHNNIHTETTIKTFCKVCDTYQACSTHFGPEISINMSSDLVIDYTRTQLDIIESGLDRGEYNSSLNNILILGLTQKVRIF